ncbi:MAG: MotA/TolQ/ExbB proton channel family protein, partial [Pirellulaceae bacterium]
MTASKQKQLSNSAISALGWPLLLGAAACSGLYILILQGPLNSPFMVRYFTSHPVLYFESGMFFVGLAALLMKTLELLRQSNAFRRIRLDDTDADADVRSVCSDLLLQLDAVPAPLQRTYLVERLSRAVAYIDRKGATDGLDDELKYLADLDGARQQESYALVRILAWAIPMLGFLGTVVGITQALGGMDYKLFATDISAAMQGLLAGLYVAFDTTALALVLSMTLMFVMFFADRVETNMLNEVDERVHGDVVLRFPDGGGRDQGYVRAVERMSSAVVKTMETLLRQQTD